MKVATFSVVLVSPVALLLLLVRGAVSVSDTQLQEEKAPARRSIAAVAREVMCDPVMIGFLVSGAFVLLMLVGSLLKEFSHVKGSHKDRIGTLILNLGFLGLNALYFFFIHPIAALRVWRLWRQIRPRQ
ncbi:hypothetical protein EJB05_49075 [Eragrostis curvula]|uniref:Uncharacterized protein n=1 Tax=Eragrostis curvula TaxID=38414 RepID=A0A5J9T5X2_9POAL|nr:hypothetical protein EJB05_49075 [Eragrostis curvula]